MSLWDKLTGSFDNSNTGFSARKTTAFAVICLITYCHLRFVDKTNSVEVIIIDSLLLLLFGLVTFQQVIEFKNGSKTSTKTRSNRV